MSLDQFSFEGIEHIEDRIRRLAEDASYIAVWDRTERKTEEPAGRFELTQTDAVPYLTPNDGLPPAFDPDEEEEEDDEEEPSIEHALSMAVGGGILGDLTPAQIAEAACRWLRDLAIRHTFAEAYRRFRVRICGPKGIHTLDGGSFL